MSATQARAVPGVISLARLARDFRVGDQTVHALRDVDLEIARGDYLSIMGPSGSGKSTLLHIIGLLDGPTRGVYRLDGRDVTGLSDAEAAQTRRSQIGFVFQFFHLVPRLTARENIELPMMLAGIPPADRRRRVQPLLERLGIAERADHRPDQLSGGQRQRVAIGRATVMQPDVILADEPTGNLDSVSGREVLEILEELNRQGMTLIVVTHDADIGRRTPRRIRMVDGRIESDERVPASGSAPA